MKQLLSFITFTLLLIQLSNAQSPQSIPFQAVARDSNGVLLPNKAMSVRISIHDSTATGAVSYSETQAVTTNNLGLFSLSIGTGSLLSGAFNSINWAVGSKFVQLEVDPNGGTNYLNLGTSQFQSVPYALYAPSSSPWQLTAGKVILTDNSKPVAIGSTTGITPSTLMVNGSVTIQNTQSPTSVVGLRLDSFRADMYKANFTTGVANIISVGYEDYVVAPGFTDSSSIIAISVDAASNIMHGFYATPDSSEILTSALGHSGHFAINSYYGLVGTRAYSTYMDCSYNNGGSLNSFTMDSTGMHWEYRDTDRYTFPLRDGSPGQVLTTNGIGTLDWSNPSSGGSAWTTSSSNLYQQDTTQNVGIGTSNPQAKLDILGGLRATYLTTDGATSTFYQGGNFFGSGSKAVGTTYFKGNFFSFMASGDLTNMGAFTQTSELAAGNLSENKIAFVNVYGDSRYSAYGFSAGLNYGAQALTIGIWDTTAIHIGGARLELSSNTIGIGNTLLMFPDTSTPGALYNDGYGNLSWQASTGSVSTALGQIPYGTGSGITSDPYFSRDVATQSTNIFSVGRQTGSEFIIDTNKVIMIHGRDHVSTISILQVGDGTNLNAMGMPLNLDTQCVVAAIFNPDREISFGLSARNDSVEIIASDPNHNYGLVGAQHFSTYMDIGFSDGHSLNSLTLDTLGLHFQYRDTAGYTFPISDGSAGQVLQTNGLGNLSWSNVSGGSSPWISSSSNLYQQDSTQNVGIGISIPQAKLDILGGLRATYLTTDSATSTFYQGGNFFGLGAKAVGTTYSKDNFFSFMASGDLTNMGGFTETSEIAAGNLSENKIAFVTVYGDSRYSAHGFAAGLNYGAQALTIGIWDTTAIHIGGARLELSSNTIGIGNTLLMFPDTSTPGALYNDGYGNLTWAKDNTDDVVFTPSSGDNINAVAGTNIILSDTSLSALTITLPSSPANKETLFFTFTNPISIVSFSGGTIINPLGSVPTLTNGSVKYWLTYNASRNTWY